MISVSIVSHGHGAMLGELVAKLRSFPEIGQILLTYNIPDPACLPSSNLVSLIQNDTPKGFAENHNRAFVNCREPFFCVLNPDIEFVENPFPMLLTCLQKNDVAAVSPCIIAPDGQIEDSARNFPTLRSLARKALHGDEGRYEPCDSQQVFYPDWIAGMFMLFKSAVFRELSGFDPKYFMYYEDVDICHRINTLRMNVAVCQNVKAIHDARRDSHRNIRYMQWHFKSIVRYFFKNPERLVK